MHWGALRLGEGGKRTGGWGREFGEGVHTILDLGLLHLVLERLLELALVGVGEAVELGLGDGLLVHDRENWTGGIGRRRKEVSTCGKLGLGVEGGYGNLGVWSFRGASMMMGRGWIDAYISRARFWWRWRSLGRSGMGESLFQGRKLGVSDTKARI